MPIKRIIHKLCCNSSAMFMDFDKAIRKSHIDYFKQAGYTVPDNYSNCGIFYAKKGNLVATCAFGATRVQLRYPKNINMQEIDDFQNTLEIAIAVKTA